MEKYIFFCVHRWAKSSFWEGVQGLTSRFIVNHARKVLNAKLSFVVVFRGDVVAVEFVLEV